MEDTRRHYFRAGIGAAQALVSVLLVVVVAIPSPAAAQPSEEELKRYEGDYRLQVTPDPFGFFVKDGTLYLKEGGLGGDGQEVPLTYEDGKFVISPGHPNAFEFKQVDGEVRLYLHSGSSVFEGKPIGDDEMVGGEIFDLSDPEAWEQYWADLRDQGLTSQEMRQRYLSDIAEELGMTVPELEQEIEAKTPYWFFMFRAPTRVPEVFEVFLSVGMYEGFIPKALEWQIRGDKLIEEIRADEHIKVEEIEYSSRIADISPLYADVAYDPTKKNMPIVVIQAGGYKSSRSSILPSIFRMAKQGLFGITVSQRGVDGGAGLDKSDAWVTENYDIIDAIEYVKENYAEYVDPTNVSVWGYSGGCIDSISLATRFPDYFRFIGPYFGQFEWMTEIGPQAQKCLDGTIEDGLRSSLVCHVSKDYGGTPSQVPDNWMARDNMLGVINNPYSHILMFSDIEEGKYTATLGQMREYLAKAEELGYTNIHLNVSDENDTYRWWHAHPGGWDEGGNPDLFYSESLFIPHILNGDYPEPVLSQQGNMVVLGYVDTKPFTVWLGEGNNAVAKLYYELRTHEKVFQLERMSSDPAVRGFIRIPNPHGKRHEVFINGRPAGTVGPEPELEVECGLDDTVVVREL